MILPTPMLRERKPVLSTNLFAFDDSGKKYQLSASDFGACRQDRMGVHVRGLGAPPPTEFIPIPSEYLSADQVLLDMIEEKRTTVWRLRVMRSAVRVLFGRWLRVVERWSRRVRIEARNAIIGYRERMRRVQIKDNWGFDDFTEIAESPPEFRSRPRRESTV